MDIDQTSRYPDHRNMRFNQLIFNCKIKQYSVHSGRVRLVHDDGSISCFNDYFLSLDEVETLNGPAALVRLYFPPMDHSKDPSWLGDLDQRDGSTFIRVMLQISEFAQYYDLLRNEQNVYFVCAFEQEKDGSAGAMRWFDLTNINMMHPSADADTVVPPKE